MLGVVDVDADAKVGGVVGEGLGDLDFPQDADLERSLEWLYERVRVCKDECSRD